ncbi:MAG: hypothetical protein EBS53_15975 [Bacteroidetes bacterium]|nr:hypothetical protein [Bacteroidota bacterium]
MENDQQTPVVTPTDEFVSFFAPKLRATILGAMQALALLQRATERRHKWYVEDADVFSITVKSLESLIRKCYVTPFLELSCECVLKSHQTGVASRPYRLRKGFDPQEAYNRLEEIFNKKSEGKPPCWRQIKHLAAGHPCPSSPCSETDGRTNAFTVNSAMKWYDTALVAAFPGRVSYRRMNSNRWGRRYHPLQNLSKEGKTLSLKGTGLMDVDFSKCHPTILQNLLGGRSLALRAYLSKSQPREVKDDINAVIHGLTKPKTSLGEKLLMEMPFIKAMLLTQEQQESGRGMFDLLTKHEDRALQVVEEALEKLGKGVHLLMFDGLICDSLSEVHLRWVEGEVAVATGMNLTLAIKQIF